MERQYFLVGSRQPPPGGYEVHPVLGLDHPVVAVVATVLHDTHRDSRLATLAAVGVKHRFTCGAEEPRTWVFGQLAPTTPRGEERFTDDVIHVHRVSTPTDEAQYVLIVSAVDIGELVLGVDGHGFLSLLPSLRVHHPRRCNARIRRNLCRSLAARKTELGAGQKSRSPPRVFPRRASASVPSARGSLRSACEGQGAPRAVDTRSARVMRNAAGRLAAKGQPSRSLALRKR